MSVYKQQLYKELASFVKKTVASETNSVIVSIPGLSAYYLTHKYWRRNKNNITYITEPNQKVLKYNILAFDLEKLPDKLEIINQYLELGGAKEKFVVIVNNPSILESTNYKSSYMANHIYSTFFLKVRGEEDTNIFIDEIEKDLSKAKRKRIFELSGGIARIIKYLLTNENLLDLTEDEIINDADFVKIITPTVQAITLAKEEVLVKLGIEEQDKFKSTLLESYFNTHPIKVNIDIVVNSNFSFSEDGELSSENLSKIEGEILSFMLENDGAISKEKVAEYKWGEGSYNKYSDQAVGKTMRRLSAKMGKYKVKSIPKTGYKLEVG